MGRCFPQKALPAILEDFIGTATTIHLGDNAEGVRDDFSKPGPQDPSRRGVKGGNVKFELRSITVSIAALFLAMGTAMHGQTANKHLIAGMYSIASVENIDSQHVKLSLHLQLFNHTSDDVELVNFVFRPAFPIVTSRRTPLPQLQTIASSLAMPSRNRVEITKDIILSRPEYLVSLHERRLLFQATVQTPDGTTQTQNVVLHASPFTGVK